MTDVLKVVRMNELNGYGYQEWRLLPIVYPVAVSARLYPGSTRKAPPQSRFGDRHSGWECALVAQEDRAADS